MRTKISSITIAVFTLLLFIIFPANSLEKVSLRIHWVPQAQFAGYYVAKAKGFYKNQGLDVDIKPGGPNTNGLKELVKGETDFAVSWLSTAIMFASKGVPINCIAQLYPKSMMVLVTKKSSNIKKITDLNQKKVGIWASGGVFYMPVKILMRKYNINPIYANQGWDIDMFLNDEIDVASAMLYNEYNQMLLKGLKNEELTIFNPADYGANFPEDGLYVSNKFLKNRKPVINKFVKATVKGWNYAINNPDEAINILMKEMTTSDVHATKEHQMKMIDVIAKNIRQKNKKVGFILKKTDFDFVKQSLQKSELLGQKKINYNNFYYKPQ